jgi:hypothetical protein
MKHSVLASIIVLFALATPTRAAHAQVQRGVVRGTVSDSAGHPIVGAMVVVKNTDIRAVTGRDGRYTLPGVYPGETEVRAQRVGFQLQSATVTVKQADTARADFMMPNIAYLSTVESDATATSARMQAFEQRRARGVGSFITRAEIEKRHPNKLSDMLRTVAGVSIKSNSSAGQQSFVDIERSTHSINNRVCEVQLYVDGHPYPHGNVDDFPPETVEGVEVYRGGAELPSEYRAQNSGCGLIGIWTRDPSLINRQP